MPAGNNKEKVQQELFINGSIQPPGVETKNPQIDPKGGNDTYETLFDLLDNDGDLIVDDGFSQGPSFFQLGAIIFDPTLPFANIQATIDDLIFYSDETGLSPPLTIRRFSTGGEAVTTTPNPNGLFDPGEPFQDYNLNGIRDSGGDPFTDLNNNGIYDSGEPFGGYYTGLTSPIRYDLHGESFADNTCTNPAGQYLDYNKNGLCDLGELYGDRNPTGYNGGEAFTDANRNRIYDGNGYFANTFTATIPAGSRIGTLSWTEYKPAGTAMNVELILKSTDGRILWQWFSDNNSADGAPVNLPVPEEARLEYRIHFLIPTTAATGGSPALDDITVTVISNPKVLYSQEASRPFQFDPSLGKMEGAGE